MGRQNGVGEGHGNRTGRHRDGVVVGNHRTATVVVVGETDAHKDRAHSNHGEEEASAHGSGFAGCNPEVVRVGHNRHSLGNGAWEIANDMGRGLGGHRLVGPGHKN